MTSEDRLTPLRLDPKDFPKRIELELSDNVANRINYLAEKSGRSFSEVVMDILSKALEP
jgi:predicted DNA-binding protein